MRIVGIRELKNRLSWFMRAVREGDRVLVTDRGKVVAELRPVDDGTDVPVHPALADLVRSGFVRLPLAPRRPELYRRRSPVARAGTARRLLDEDRADR